MPFKFILRAVGALFAPSASRVAPHPIDRLTARSDWRGEPPELGNTSPPWPPTDNPYIQLEPCPVVPDVGKVTIDKLSERGLCGPIGTNSGLQNVMELIDRQEAAEKHLIGIGMVWTRERGWHLPSPYSA